jgi:DNA replication ATP-dependent helicase Dna2
LREGDIVVLSDGKLVQGFVSTGVISVASETAIEVETRTKPGSVSVVDVYSIDVGYRRQQRGIFNIIFRRNNFRELIVKGEKSTTVPVEGKYIPTNPVQNEAVSKILGTKNYCLVQGPAGTGKTYVIAKSAIELAKSGDKVLLTAFTNRAVDNMCKYLLENQFTNFIRLGSPHAIQPEIRDFTLPVYKKSHPDKSTKEIISSFPIILATTSTISNPVYERLGIKTIIIDEASQMTEPTVLSALLEGNRFILVGDHKQLPPVVQSPKAQKEGMSVSLFERLAKNAPKSIHLLTHQFRMNEKLVEFSNQSFYDNKLKSFDDLVRFQNLMELKSFTGDYSGLENSSIYDPKSPLIYIPINGIFNPENKINMEEVSAAAEVIKNFIELGLNSDQIGVICPYRGQVGELRRSLPSKTVVDTVDRFQGSDRELILLSLTENISKGNRGFSDPRRLNVAITRAKKKLIVIGDPNISEDELGMYVGYLKDNAEVIEQKEEAKPVIVKETTIVAENVSKVAKIMKKVLVKGKKIVVSKEDAEKCMVCFQPVYENAIECPVCEHLFHFEHLVTWVKDNERCPYCKTTLRVFD